MSVKASNIMGPLFLLLLPLSAALGPGASTHLALVAEGRAQYEMVTRESSRPRYGPCWTAAMRQVEAGCGGLTDDSQARMALGLANCFLEKAGQRIYPCHTETEIEVCLEEVDNNAFNAYTNFFTHTQNMCYFLQSQVWHEDTDATIQGLAANSAAVSASLEQSHQLQQELVGRQEESLEYHRQLASGIAMGKTNVREMLEEFKVSTFEQKTLIFEVFDRVSRLQNLVVSEVSWLYTVVFYSACLLVIYLVTATRRTADARLWLFFILTANLAVERLVVRWSLPQAGEAEVLNLAQLVTDRVWRVRQAAIGLALALLAVIAYRFQDYNKINNALLEEIRKQNLELKRSMESFQVSGRAGDTWDGGAALASSTLTTLASTRDSLSSHLHQLLAEDTGFMGDEEDFSDDEETELESSLNTSGWSDTSYRPGSRELSLSGDEWGTAEASRETTPVNEEIDSAMEALGSCLVTSFTSSKPLPSSTPSKPLISTPSKPLLSTSSKPLPSSTSCQPPISSPQPQAPRYNLRRTPGRNSNSSRNTSSLAQQESPEAFALLVSKQLGLTQRNSAKWSQALKKNREAEFSSDEQ